MKYINIFITIAALACTVNFCTGAEQSSDSVNTISRMRSAIDPSGALSPTATIRLQLDNILGGKNVRCIQNIYFCENGYYYSESKVGVMAVDIRGFNGKTFWKKNFAGVVTKSFGINAMAMSFLVTFMRPGSDFGKIFTKITQDKRRYFINNFECFALQCYPPEEYKLPPYLIYVDRRDYLVRRTVITVPEFSQLVPVTTDFHEYQYFGQVRLPLSFTIYLPSTTIKSRTTGIQFIKGMPAVDFNPPAGMM